MSILERALLARPTRGRWWVRVACAGGVLAGLGTVISLFFVRPDQIAIATDVYTRAGQAMLDGGSVYAVSPADHPGYTFQYPPVIALLAIAYGVAGPTVAYVGQIGIDLLALGALATLVLDRLPADRGDRRLGALTILTAGPVASALAMGQISPVVALCVVGGYLLALADRVRASGFGLGLAALLKVYPAGAWAWLLARRSWRAVAVAVAVVSVGWLANVAVGIELTHTYVTTVLFEESSTAVFADGPPLWPGYVTVMRPLSALGIRGVWLWVIAAAIVGPAVLASYRDLDSAIGAETAALATVLGLLAVVPLESFYFTMAVPLLVLVAHRIEDHPAVRLLAIGTLLIWVAVPPGPLTAMASPLPPTLGGIATWIGESVLRYVQAPLVGAGFVLGACVWVHHDLAHGRSIGRPSSDG
ncbi:MAG: glycosyltransferase family 87 protein [Halococcoides sp.]